MVFKHLGISEGFNQTNVTTLYQDENGTIWAAGVGGVVRYRGLQTEEPLMPERAAELFRPMNVKGIYGEQNATSSNTTCGGRLSGRSSPILCSTAVRSRPRRSVEAGSMPLPGTAS